MKNNIMIVAHMDDELIAGSALLAHGAINEIIYVTDSSTRWAGPDIMPMTPGDYAESRRMGAEYVAEAFNTTPVFLDWSNDSLRDLPASQRQVLLRSIDRALMDPIGVLVTHYPGDTHYEHQLVSAMVSFIATMRSVPVVYMVGDGQSYMCISTPETVSMRVEVQSEVKLSWLSRMYPLEADCLSEVGYDLRPNEEIFMGTMPVFKQLSPTLFGGH